MDQLKHTSELGVNNAFLLKMLGLEQGDIVSYRPGLDQREYTVRRPTRRGETPTYRTYCDIAPGDIVRRESPLEQLRRGVIVAQTRRPGRVTVITFL